jgi:membrane-bound lytic murein transglycosylase B
MQRLLAAKGFATGGVDGKVGPGTREAIRAYQAKAGMLADGTPSLTLLERRKSGG